MTVPVRRELPAKRETIRQTVRIGTVRVYVDLGLYEDGTLGELFLTIKKTGAQERAWLDGLARSVSIGLQHGIPVEQFVEIFLGSKFEPAGVVSGHDRIKLCTSPLDFVARELGLTFCGREDLAQVGGV